MRKTTSPTKKKPPWKNQDGISSITISFLIDAKCAKKLHQRNTFYATFVFTSLLNVKKNHPGVILLH